MLLLPDGNALLQPVDAGGGGLQRGAAMRRGGNHGHAGLADQEPAQAMHQRHTGEREVAGELAADLRHHFERHRFVAFVIQKPRGVLGSSAADRTVARLQAVQPDGFGGNNSRGEYSQ